VKLLARNWLNAFSYVRQARVQDDVEEGDSETPDGPWEGKSV
jgi:hypothetical protein